MAGSIDILDADERRRTEWTMVDRAGRFVGLRQLRGEFFDRRHYRFDDHRLAATPFRTVWPDDLDRRVNPSMGNGFFRSSCGIDEKTVQSDIGASQFGVQNTEKLGKPVQPGRPENAYFHPQAVFLLMACTAALDTQPGKTVEFLQYWT